MPDPTPYSVPQTEDDLPIASSDLRALMQQYHDAIGAQVDGTLADLQARWAPVRATMDLEITRIQQQMEAALAHGDTLTAGWLAEAQRLTALKSLVEGNVAQFAAAAQQDIGAAQLAAIRAGGQAAQETLQATVPPGVNYTFGVPPASVTAQFAGALQDGSPLAALFSTFGPEAADRAGQALFTSIALGENPRVAAQRLQWATDLPRQRAEVIARTEILRSWRSAQLANYRANSDVVQGWQWAADFGPRCCGACCAMDGTIHSLDEELDDHVAGRCSALPITGSWASILQDAGVAEADIPQSLREADAQASADARGMGRPTASEWLAQQPPEIQNQIMGPAKAEAWRQGAFNLSDLVGVRHDPQWGSSIQELSLKQMGLDAQDWLAKAREAGNGSALADAETQAAAEASALAMKTGATQPLGTQDTTALSESPVWQEIANTLTPEAEATSASELVAGAPVGVQPFSVEPRTFRSLRAEEKQLEQLIVTNPDENVGDSKARIAQELATRLQDNPAFAALPQRLVDNYLDELRAQGYMEQDVAYIAERFSSPPTLEEATSLLVHSWASGKGSLFPAIQQAVEQEFGLANTYSRFDESVLAASQAAWGDAEARAGLQAFVREMYNNTQEYLAEQGITEVTLYRGMVFAEPPAGLDFAAIDGANGGSAQTLAMALQPASSFTSSPKTAKLFANISVMGGSFNAVTGEVENLGNYRFLSAATVPASDILSTAMSGFGARGEAEFVVLGGQYEMRAVGQYVTDPMDPTTALTPTDFMNLMTTVPRTTKTALDWERIRALETSQEGQ